MPQGRPRPHPFTSFPIYYSLIQLFDAMYSLVSGGVITGINEDTNKKKHTLLQRLLIVN
jgi:hypothetical protein